MKKQMLIITGLFLLLNVGVAQAVDESENQGIKSDCEKITDARGRTEKSDNTRESKDSKVKSGSKTTGE